tara:strand:+ start:31444 stop:32145 length:702 start_codon:yes stop_codon:yes gene_type:complete
MHKILSFILFISSCQINNDLLYYDNNLISVNIESDKEIEKIIMPYKKGIDSIMDKIICTSQIEMRKDKPEGVLGNFVTDLCLEKFSESADICILNNGGFRSSLPKGDISLGMIYTLMPFENELVILHLTKSDTEDLVNYMFNRGGEPCSGIKVYNIDTNVFYSLNNKINFDNDEKIRVLTSDYLAKGGDKMYFFQNKEIVRLNVKLRDIIIEYCKENKVISSNKDNRFIINND